MRGTSIDCLASGEHYCVCHTQVGHPDERWRPREVLRNPDKVSSVACLVQATVCAHNQTTQFIDRIDRQRDRFEMSRSLWDSEETGHSDSDGVGLA